MDESCKVKRIIGDRMRMIRTQKKLSQKELSEQAEINDKYLSRVERGVENVTLETLLKITSTLGISLEELFKGSQSFYEEPGLVINEVISILQTRNEEDHKLVLDLLNMLFVWKG